MKNFLKSTRITLFLVTALLATGILLLAGGCSSGPPQPRPKALNVEISATPLAASLTIRVYVGFANDAGNKGMVEDPIDTILQNGTGEMKSYQLGKAPFTLSDKDPVWYGWLHDKGARELVIIADLPKNFGGAEKRRIHFTLNRYEWKHLIKNTVHVVISEKEVKLVEGPHF